MKRLFLLNSVAFCAATSLCSGQEQIRLPELRGIVNDWSSHLESFSGEFTTQFSADGATVVSAGEMITTPLTSRVFWSPVGWFDHGPLSNESSVSNYYDGSSTTQIIQRSNGVVDVHIRRGEGEWSCDAAFQLLARKLPHTDQSVEALLSHAHAVITEQNDEAVVVSLAYATTRGDQRPRSFKVRMVFSREVGWLLTEYVGSQEYADDSGSDTITMETSLRFDEWQEVRDESTASVLRVPLHATKKMFFRGELEGTSSIRAENLRLNPSHSRALLRPVNPPGANVTETLPSGKTRTFIAGGKVEEAKRSEEEEREITESKTFAAANGVTFRAVPQSSWTIPSLRLAGLMALAGAGILRWRSRRIHAGG